jgi:Leucine-rich repeat (LRR) protein
MNVAFTPTIAVNAGLEKCPELNTLVLSHNKIDRLGGWLQKSSKLEKLSCSHNQLQDLGTSLK